MDCLAMPPHGSSPHTRGARSEERIGVMPGRIIPAYAGSTDRGVHVIEQTPDHPRIRGEHVGFPPGFPEFQGSSPHTRGAQRAVGAAVGAVRIIPAYAGSTRRFSSPSFAMADHPRIRGEHPRTGRSFVLSSGSSPHTRGAQVPDRDTLRVFQDHPRIRGEHARRWRRWPWVSGSSPHTRGARLRPESRRRRRRIIPAYAGSTVVRLRIRRPSRDHPRIRGEHRKKQVNISVNTGSSPHTRGAPLRRRQARHRRRIIPAYAGSTSTAPAGSSSAADHPRIRGEHTSGSVSKTEPVGSSPHTRGAPVRDRRPLRREGIIPAYAGSTRVAS